MFTFEMLFISFWITHLSLKTKMKTKTNPIVFVLCKLDIEKSNQQLNEIKINRIQISNNNDFYQQCPFELLVYHQQRFFRYVVELILFDVHEPFVIERRKVYLKSFTLKYIYIHVQSKDEEEKTQVFFSFVMANAYEYEQWDLQYESLDDVFVDENLAVKNDLNGNFVVDDAQYTVELLLDLIEVC